MTTQFQNDNINNKIFYAHLSYAVIMTICEEAWEKGRIYSNILAGFFLLFLLN